MQMIEPCLRHGQGRAFLALRARTSGPFYRFRPLRQARCARGRYTVSDGQHDKIGIEGKDVFESLVRSNGGALALQSRHVVAPDFCS